MGDKIISTIIVSLAGYIEKWLNIKLIKALLVFIAWSPFFGLKVLPSFAQGYGDLIKPHELIPDPRIYFARKFEEGLAECINNLPQALLEKCRHYYDTHIHLLDSVDGPCITHRDFRPGNVIVNKGKIAGIIDWASARAGFAQEDFCTMEHGEWPIHSDTKKDFLAGYARVRPVPDYRAIMPLLRLSKAIATTGFTIKRRTWQNSSAALYKFNRHYLETFNS